MKRFWRSSGGYRRRARTVVCVWLWCMAALLVALPAAAAPDLNDQAALGAFLDGIMTEQLNSYRVPGVTLSIVQDGDVLFSRGYGYADLDDYTAVDPEQTLFRVGSVSKLVTGTAVMQLVEEGQLELDRDINDYLDFQVPDRVLSEGAGAPITMRHLLTHTPGLEDAADGLFFLSEDRMMPLGEYLQRYKPAGVFEPGQLLAYSNYGSALAGYAVEQITGQPFAEYVDEHIFEPLAMERSSFQQPLPPEWEADLARAYKYVEDTFHEGDFEFIPAAPAGALSTTAADMARFMMAHLGDGTFQGETILLPETTEKMHARQFTHHPQLSGVTLGFFEDTVNGRRILAHSGGTMLFFSHMFLVPEEDVGLFVSYSGGTEAGEVLRLPRKLFQAFMDQYFPGPEVSVPSPQEDAAARAAGFAGEYHPTRMSFTGDEKFMGLIQAVQLQGGDDGYLRARIMGSAEEFVELEPGLYINRDIGENPMVRKLALSEHVSGQTLLAMGGASYLQAPWYGTLTFLGALMAFSVLMIIVTLMGWTGAWAVRRARPGTETVMKPGERAARFAAVGFSLTTAAFLAGMAYTFGQVDPAYGVPDIVFGITTPLTQIVFWLPWLMIVLGALTVVCAGAAWFRRYWTTAARLHYSLIALSSIAMFWVLWFTNMFP